jgi:transcriptional regulator with GAF, ATPase, and Fis domain
VTVNCAALPPGLIESELFGHLAGAFSGATRARIGRFQAANGGTLCLDEIGELPIELQPKLLRALQEGMFEPVGSDISVLVDVRVVASTNRDLEAGVKDGSFREDLYYRLNVFPMRVPPLRERTDDIRVIAAAFLAALSRRTGRGPWTLSESVLSALEAHPFPGNVRELVNVLERATIVGPNEEFDALAEPSPAVAAGAAGAPPPAEAFEPAEFPTLESAERHHIERALARTRGRIYGDGGAAEILDIHPNTLLSRMRRLGMGGARDYRRRHADD